MFTRWVSVSAGICRGNCGIAALFGHILNGRRTIRHTSGPAGQITRWTTHCTAHCTTRCTTHDIWSLHAEERKKKKNVFWMDPGANFQKKQNKQRQNIFSALMIDGYWLCFSLKRRLLFTTPLLRLPADVVSAAAGVTRPYLNHTVGNLVFFSFFCDTSTSRWNSSRVTAAR